VEVDASNRRDGEFAIDERDLGYFKIPCQRGCEGDTTGSGPPVKRFHPGRIIGRVQRRCRSTFSVRGLLLRRKHSLPDGTRRTV
jgi:hypothetical protein